jgi:hypothetical protein
VERKAGGQGGGVGRRVQPLTLPRRSKGIERQGWQFRAMVPGSDLGQLNEPQQRNQKEHPHRGDSNDSEAALGEEV